MTRTEQPLRFTPAQQRRLGLGWVQSAPRSGTSINRRSMTSLACACEFARPHQSLKTDKGRITPAMAAGVADRVWSLTDIARLLD